MVYDWKKTLKKVLWISAEVVVAGLVVYFTDNSLYIAIIPALEALRNYIKHRK